MKLKGIVAMAFVILAWGITFVNTRALLFDFSALEIQVIRFAMAWVALRAAEAVMQQARALAFKAMPREMFATLPPWEVVAGWPGKIVAVMDYAASMDARPGDPWYEGYPVNWRLSRVKRLATPIPCRGNVGMWRMDERLSAAVSAAVGEG